MLLVFNEFMYVGFTGTNAPLNNSMEGHVLYSWSFKSGDLLDPRVPLSPKSSKSMVLLVSLITALLAAVGLSMTVIIVCCLRMRNKKEGIRVSNTFAEREPEYDHSICPISEGLHRYTYKELRTATNGFDEDNKIGSGGSSSVYKGTLPSGLIIAVKKPKDHLRREDDFVSEINIINGIRQRNLLQLQGWCYERGKALLVYKYMRNGSLENYIWGKKWGTLQSDTRFKVLIGVASALEYLHCALPNCVLHRDVKAANVMLDDHMVPLLGDFGLARLISHDEVVLLTATGTPGYAAPEVIFGGKGDEKVDVYSFGVLALEIACGRPALSIRSGPGNKEVRLVEWVWRLNLDNELMSALDESLKVENLSEAERKKWIKVLLVGLTCCNASASARPSMRQVIQALEGSDIMLPIMNQQQQRSSTRAGTANGANFQLHFHIETPFGCSSSASSTGTSLSSHYEMHASDDWIDGGRVSTVPLGIHEKLINVHAQGLSGKEGFCNWTTVPWTS